MSADTCVVSATTITNVGITWRYNKMTSVWICILILTILVVATAVMTFRMLEWEDDADAELEMIGEALQELKRDIQRVEKQQKFNEEPYSELKQRVNKLELVVNHISK